MTVLTRFVAGNLLLPCFDLARGTSRFAFGHILEKTQRLSKSEIEAVQIGNLRKLIQYAYDTVPYYHRTFRRYGIHPMDIKQKADLCRLPILTKKDLRQNFHDLVSTKYPLRRLVRSQSGGTGDQISFYSTKEQISWEIAAEYRAYGWAGFRRGDRCLLLWGSPIDVPKQADFIHRITNSVEQVLFLNTYALSDEVLLYYANLMRKFRPEVIRGYASSVYMLAKFLLDHDISCSPPRCVITSAETLLPNQRAAIERCFGTKVFDYYGSREIGAIAAECEKHGGYHINAENVLLEFVRGEEPVEEGESGLILVTNLRNYGMPLIRYAIGDVGQSSKEICSCGRGLPLISSLQGRVSQFMTIRDEKSGDLIKVSTAAPGIFSQILMLVPIEDYRIVQESIDHVVIKAVRGKSYSDFHSDFIASKLRKYLGGEVKVDVEFVDEIPPLPSGKRSVFSSKISSFEN